MKWLGHDCAGSDNQDVRTLDPCFKRSVPQCNELRKMVFKITEAGLFPSALLAARLIHLNTLLIHLNTLAA